MYRSTRLLVITLALTLSAAILTDVALAQSGRGRQPTAPPQPKPTPKPNLPATKVLGVPEGGKLVKQDLDGLTSRFLLQNGLTVIIHERHSSPLVSVNVTVKAGSINESDESAGMARLVRHMILKGTSKLPGAAIEKEVARLGGILSSQLSYDSTSFNIMAPTESYQAMVELLADLIQRPVFKADELKKASQLVLLESKREQDLPEKAAIDKLYATAFAANGLKRGSSVSESMLASVTREQLLTFYQNHYHPANTIVTVVGDVFMLQALGQVQLQFGTFAKAGGTKPAAPSSTPATAATSPRAGARNTAPLTETAIVPIRPDTSSSNPEEPAHEGLRYSNSRSDISHSLVTIGYRTPAFKPDNDGLKELTTMQMLAAVLGLGKGSRLWQDLREGQASRDKMSVATETSADFLTLPGAGILIIQLRVDPDGIDRAEAEYFKEIERFRRELISEGELRRARVMLEKQYYDIVSRLEIEANALARYQLHFGDYRLDPNLARIRAVTPQEIQQAAAKYLTLSNATVHEYEPRNAQARTFTAEKFAELIVTFVSNAGQPIKPEEVKPAIVLKTFTQGAERGLASEGQNIAVASVPLPIKDFSVLRGPRAYVREDKSLPKLSMSVVFQGGRFIEDQTTSGMTELMLRSMLKSTTTRKFDLIALELESYGAEIRIINEPDFFGFTLDVLSRNAENSLKLLLDIIENPFFDKEEIAKERLAVLASQRHQRDDEDSRAIELMWASLYPSHPYGLPRFGLPEVVKAATEEKLEAWYANTVKKQLPLVVLVGDTDGSALVSRIFSEGLKRGELDKSIKVSLPATPPQPQEKIEQRAHQLTAQAIGFGVSDQSLSTPNDLIAFEMLGNLANSGRLIAEIGEKQGLTDRVPVEFEQRLASGAFFTHFATLPENEQRARETVLAEFQRLGGALPSDEEFEQGRNAAIGRYAIRLQTHPERAQEYARAVIYNRKPSDVETQPDFVRSVKKADIKRIAESVIKVNQAGRGVVRASKQ